MLGTVNKVNVRDGKVAGTVNNINTLARQDGKIVGTIVGTMVGTVNKLWSIKRLTTLNDEPCYSFLFFY